MAILQTTIIILLFATTNFFLTTSCLNCSLGTVQRNQTCPISNATLKTYCDCPKQRTYRNTYYYCKRGSRKKNRSSEIYILNGRWGYEKNGNLETAACPFGYCKDKNGYSDYLLFDRNNQCAEDRKGRLCSECKEGYSVAFGSERCEKCKNINILIIIVFFLALSLVVMVLMYFNIDAFSGYLNAFMYSYQIMSVFIPKYVELDPVSLFLMYVLGLQGTGSTFAVCFYNGMDNLDKIAWNYMLPGYIMLFTVLIGQYMPKSLWTRFFSRENETRRNSIGRAFSFVLVIFYTSITTITLDLMDRDEIEDKNVVYKAAFIVYLTGKHVYLFLLAIIVLTVFVLPFPIILGFTPFFQKHFPRLNLHRLEPILNSMKSGFKENREWFSSFYFFCRLILLVSNLFIKTDVTRAFFLAMFCTLFLLIFATVQPYEGWTFNFWDLILLANLCFMSITGLILQVRLSVTDKIRERLIILFKTLVYLPLVTGILRCIWHWISIYYVQRRNNTDSQGKKTRLWISSDNQGRTQIMWKLLFHKIKLSKFI
jgi:hypothetical protein